MLKRKVVISLSLVGVLVLALTVGAVAQGRGGGPRGPNPTPCWQRAGVADELGLTADQVTALDAEHDRYAAEMAAGREKMSAARDAMKAALKDDDQATYQAKKQEMADMAAEHAELRSEHLANVREIMTAEQFEKFGEICGQGNGRGRGMKGNRGRPMGRGPAGD